MSEMEIGRGKRGSRAWAFDDIAIVPSRRTRDPKDVSTAWKIDAYEFGLPVIGAPMDSVVSPDTAVAIGKLGGLGVLDLEGLWTRYEDPTKQLAEIAALSADEATVRMQQIYAEPIKAELIRDRIAQIRAAGVTVAGSLTPQRAAEFSDVVVKAGVGTRALGVLQNAPASGEIAVVRTIGATIARADGTGLTRGDSVSSAASGVARATTNDDGLSTAEYAVGTVAAAGLGGVLIKLLTSSEVRDLIWSVLSPGAES